MLKWKLGVFGTVAFLSGLLFAQQPTTPEPKKGRVEGAVIDAQSRQPLPNTELTLLRVDLFDSPPKVIRGGDPMPPPSILKTTTDQSGKYQFLDVEPGRYSLSAQKSGYGSATGLVTKNNAPVRAGTILLLSADKSRRLRQRSPKTGMIDENARFTIHGIPEGDYLAFAFEETEQGFWRDEERFRKFEGRAKKVSIEKNASADVNLETTPLPN